MLLAMREAWSRERLARRHGSLRVLTAAVPYAGGALGFASKRRPESGELRWTERSEVRYAALWVAPQT